MKMTVLGGGGWGTAMARLLALRGHDTCLWVRDPARAGALARERENRKYLPGVELPASLVITSDLGQAAAHGEVFLFAVPSFAMRPIARRLAGVLGEHRPVALVSLAKGIERGTLATMSEVLAEELAGSPVFALSGPSHAEEVGRDEPTAVVLAGRDVDLGAKLQEALMTDRFRVYLTDDLCGVEYGATVKNVIAVAAGMCDGLGYGDNAKGALVARGLAEMVRLAVHIGARKETLFGLSGLGDLVTTCTSRHSRNRLVGERIGRGEGLGDILAGMDMVAEGVYAAQAVRALARARGVEMPITEAVYAILYEGAVPLAKVDELMGRPPKRERL
ncbi:MAG: NAD(P)-dependent glycerol-3-phosphate dehydrogenase [Candidatus Acetothermia bacterium]|jgi:glycerol-3-phosphate dehydrogenase (NAD(P)+)|nr:NAD(P)-dependent glycerol-3-phosphate dehydrogenase [Candidatus Acetothermia bacterium]